MRRLLLFLFLAPAVFAQCPGHSYSTTFTGTENPISESNCWINGGTTGVFWGNVQTSGGQAHGTITNSTTSFGPPFNDSTAVLAGTWGPNQYARATVRINATDTSNQQEVELRTHTTIAANSTTGYEFDINVKNGQAYVVIVRWNPGTNQFTYCQNNSTCTGTLATNSIPAADGDVFEANSIGSKHTLYKNGTAVFTTTDATYTGGSPGVGFWMVEGNTQNCTSGYGAAPCSHLLDFGLTNFSASDSTYEAATCNQADVNGLINNTGGSQQHQAIDGDTIKIPAGSCPWSAGISATSNIQIIGSGTQNLNSVCTPASQVGCGPGVPTTIITDNAGGSNLISLHPTFTAGNPLPRISTLNIIPGTTSASALVMSGTCTASGCPPFRIDNVTTNDWDGLGISGNAFGLLNNVWGVVDHIKCGNQPTGGTGGNPTCFDIGHGNWGGIGNWGDNSWASASTPGTNRAVYLENNIIVGDVLTDTEIFGAGWGGARFVVRFNQWTAINVNGAATNHGTDTTGRPRAGRWWEAYGNFLTCNNSGNGCNSTWPARGGTGRSWSNTVVVGGSGFFKKLGAPSTDRLWRLVFWPICDGSAPWDGNDGTIYFSGTMQTIVNNGTGYTLTDNTKNFAVNQLAPNGAAFSVHDTTKSQGAQISSNTATTITIGVPDEPHGYVPVAGDTYQILRASYCMDQVGHSGGILMQDSSDTKGIPVLSTTGNPGQINETIDPVYEANDALPGGATGTYTSGSNAITGRDIFSETVNQGPNTNPTTPFNGSNGQGAGHGPIAQRPASGTLNAGYLATDCPGATGCPAGTPWNTVPGGIQGTWFKWNGTAWVSEPVLTYPHPLITGGVIPPTPAVSFSPPGGINFGSLTTGTTSSIQFITVNSIGTANLTWTNFSTTQPSGTTFNDLAGGGTCPQANAGGLAPGGSCTVALTAVTNNVGLQSGTFNFPSNAGAQAVTLQVTGTSAALPGVNIAPSSNNYGNQAVHLSASQTFTITSTTSSNLIMSTPPATITGTNANDFQIQAIGSQCTNGQSISQTNFCLESVVFTPSVIGLRTAQLNIFDNVSGSPQVIPLLGNGTTTVTTGTTMQGVVIQ
jgi:hypothetical protein